MSASRSTSSSRPACPTDRASAGPRRSPSLSSAPSSRFLPPARRGRHGGSRPRRGDAGARQAGRRAGLLPAALGRAPADLARARPHAARAGRDGRGALGPASDALRHRRLAFLRHEQLGDLSRPPRGRRRRRRRISRRSAAPRSRWLGRPKRSTSRRWARRSAGSGRLGGGSRPSSRRRRSRRPSRPGARPAPGRARPAAPGEAAASSSCRPRRRTSEVRRALAGLGEGSVLAIRVENRGLTVASG